MRASRTVTEANDCGLAEIDAVVFDLDGTLLDSEPLYRKAFLGATQALGYLPPTDLYPKLVGRSTRDRGALLSEWLGSDFPFEDFKQHYTRLKSQILASKVPARSGAEALVRELFDRGVPLAIATSASRRTALHLLDDSGLTPYFQVIVTRDDVHAGKPEPATHKRAAELLGLRPRGCVALEDSEVGLLAAHRAGMMPVMVTDATPVGRELRRISHAVVPDIPQAARLIGAAIPARSSPAKRRGSAPRPAGSRKLQVIIIGLTISSSWGNGHATTYRSLARGLAQAGHSVVFLEHDKPWYRDSRDLVSPSYVKAHVYQSVEDLQRSWASPIRDADLVIIGSYVPDGRQVCSFVQQTARGVIAFYDIDTPVTLRGLLEDTCTYLQRAAIKDFDLYLSFTGGPILRVLERKFGARRALPLYCSVDASVCRGAMNAAACGWDLGYLGTYSQDRQPALEELLCCPAESWGAGRFVVAGPLYPSDIAWPANVEKIEHAPPGSHSGFYGAQRFTLNVTRSDMKAWGYSPSVRLFEAAACGTPIISDAWPGMATLFRPDEEILHASSSSDVLKILQSLSEDRRESVAARARERVLADHTGDRRAEQLAGAVAALLDRRPSVSVFRQR